MQRKVAASRVGEKKETRENMTSATPDGNLLVYDATGQHLYALATVVPEASTFALILPALGMIGAVIVRRRKTAK